MQKKNPKAITNCQFWKQEEKKISFIIEGAQWCLKGFPSASVTFTGMFLPDSWCSSGC